MAALCHSFIFILASLLWQNAFSTSSLRTAGSRTVAGTLSRVAKACSCDCCLVEQDDQALQGKVGTLKCAPKSGSFSSGESSCSDICRLPQDLMSSFDSQNGDVDSSRFCTRQCTPASTQLHDLCVASSMLAEAAAPATGSQRSKDIMAQVSSEVVSGQADADAALVVVAKQKMEEAKLQAEAAGRAATTARTAYERLRLTQDELAAQASEATLHEVKTEAKQQSTDAYHIRQSYERTAQATASSNAVAAANVYAKAMARDMATAAAWQERAVQFADAANQREAMAMGFQADAEEYRKRNDAAMSKQRLVMAHQSLDQAAAFGAQSEAAHEQAQTIANSKSWYNYAKRAAADFVLAKSMPHDVPPPPMPALP